MNRLKLLCAFLLAVAFLFYGLGLLCIYDLNMPLLSIPCLGSATFHFVLSVDFLKRES